MNKITVMIVDDERLTIEDFIDMFDWETNGFEIVATANNGRQALAKFKRTQPQIVISDIKMPLMDGIELVNEIRKLNSKTKLILLSAYGEFEYARKAIKIGIVDYLLKSEISKEIISRKLCDIKDEIIIEKQNYGLIKEKIVQDLLQSNIDGHFNTFQYDSNVEQLISERYYHIIIEQDYPLPIVKDIEKFNKVEYKQKVIDMCKDFIRQDFHVKYVCYLEENRFLLFIESCRKHSEKDIYFNLRSNCINLQKKLIRQTGNNYTFFISYNMFNLVDFKEKYSDYKKKLKLKYLLGNGKIYDINNLKDADITEKKLIDILDIEEKLKYNNESGFIEYIDTIFEEISSRLEYNRLLHFSKLLYKILERETECLLATTQCSKINLKIMRKNWMNVSDIKQWMKNSFRTLIQARLKEGRNSYSQEVIKAIQYIYQNYKERDLRIDEIARNVGWSANRLSVMFKKDTSLTVNEYLTKVRINKAKELICKEKYKIYQIASMVGYGSSQYFSKIFAKETGQTPSQYRKRGKT
ncbi:response regulator [Halocella sp. SP3-1]|uniref:response regulator transcription factor n=1 Tax=Halocella sp. SP3-1 TaxID=2382161 RepID=UPI000F756FB4|nr:response regulator [Halocella sp. SP3-1]AZO96267.1 response regulator [Halocella sp. SP3-1]